MIHSEFRWATGVECSFIPHLNIDQYRWTQHDRFWRADLELIANDLGCRWLRYALPWHEIEPQPGHYDWQWFDERLAHFDQLGIRLMLDLVHFGTPTWLPDAFADTDFPQAIERFARAFGERYANRVPCVSPINEPLITALFCGDVGLWPPYGRGLGNYMTVLSRVAQGVCRATRALRETMPGVEILVCDSLEVAATCEDSDASTSPYLTESLRDDVVRRMHRRHIVTDLVLGRVTGRHPLLSWLKRHGFSDFDLNWFRRHAQTIDIIGLDYYEHTEVELYTTPEGYYRQRPLKPPVGIYQAAQNYWSKYHIPLMITETSIGGPDETKIAWLEKSVACVRRLRAEGFPVIGYTWWPVIDHLDWDGALLHQTGHIHPVGIYRLERRSDGRLERVATGLCDEYRALIAGGDETAGPFIETDAQREHRETRASALNAPVAVLSWPIIVHGCRSWDGLMGRAQHVFSHLSKSHRILYINPPRWHEDEPAPRSGLGFYPLLPNLCTLTIHLPTAMQTQPDLSSQACHCLLTEALSQTPLSSHYSNPVQWFCDQSAWPMFGRQPSTKAIVVECSDAPLNADLLQVADGIFTTSHSLQKLVEAENHVSTHVPDGVDVRHFARTHRRRLTVPNDIAFIPKPVVGYFGAIDEKLDLALIARLADEHAHWSIVMVGPVRNVDPDTLPRRQNIFWLGCRPYGEMPAYALGFDLCIAPFTVNDATPWLRPAQIGEYLMAGRPVVCTTLPEVRQDFADLVAIADTHDEFIESCNRALSQPNHDAMHRGRRTMAKANWRHVAATMERQIDAFIAS